MYLSVGAVSLSTLPALEEAGLGPTRSGHLGVTDRLLHKLLTHLLHVITCHLL